MPKKEILVAQWRYRDAKGVLRRAYFGDIVDLTAAEVRRAKAAGVFDPPKPEAKPADKPAPSRRAAKPAAEEASLPEVPEDDGDDLDGLDDEPADVEAADDDAEAGEVGRPKQAAAKSAWVDYAVSTGFDREDAESMDKYDLIAALK